MALTDYTTFDDVRAALGVSADELEDATLSLPLYEFGLMAEIRGVSLDLDSDFTTVASKDSSTLTSAESVLFESMVLFCTYAVGRQLLTSLPLFSPKEISDGKASVGRYAMNPYKDTIERVERDYQRWRDALVTAYAAYKATSAPTRVLPVLLSRSALATDPVTG